MDEIKIIFKRKLYDRLLAWKKESQGTTALLIEGPRRVGKSTLVEEFAKNEYESYILIDFARAPKAVSDLFEDISDLNYLFMRLQLYYNVELHERKSLIIFDEVQKQPLARQAIKYLVQDRRYDYIETGSLISIKKNVEDIMIPSEEERMYLYPMDYEEFRWALGDKVTMPLLKTVFESKRPVGDGVNRKLMRDFRLYMLVGGMPQAVNAYIQNNNLQSVDKVKRNIISLYEDDFRKIDPSGRISALFDAIPSELNKNTSRYQVTSVIGSQIEDKKIEEFVADMQSSMTVNLAYHANDPGTGMSLNQDTSKYKMFVCDTGLFVTLAFKDRDFTENEIYEKLLNDKLDANLGYIFENIVAQTLVATGNKLFYYTFPRETSNHLYEVDFLLSRGNKISPVEVKSSSYKRHKSLDEFCEKYSNRIGSRYILYTKDLRKDKNILYLPVYLTQFI